MVLQFGVQGLGFRVLGRRVQGYSIPQEWRIRQMDKKIENEMNGGFIWEFIGKIQSRSYTRIYTGHGSNNR